MLLYVSDPDTYKALIVEITALGQLMNIYQVISSTQGVECCYASTTRFSVARISYILTKEPMFKSLKAHMYGSFQTISDKSTGQISSVANNYITTYLVSHLIQL